MDTALGIVELFPHVMSFFSDSGSETLYLHATLVAEIYFTLNENTSTYPSGMPEQIKSIMTNDVSEGDT